VSQHRNTTINEKKGLKNLTPDHVRDIDTAATTFIDFAIMILNQ